ncbi:MAG: hypothetical protein IJP86_01930 [Synergistaceae bacterium]|nr:hypothetical protein [Synergistaceae bacterium]
MSCGTHQSDNQTHYNAVHSFTKRIWKKRGVTLRTELGDEKILAEGTLDFVSFSYYRSNTISKASKVNVILGDPNPYLLPA